MTECANCGGEIRPTADGDGIAVDDREYYAWVGASGNPVCMTLVHQPKAAEPEPDVWVVLVEDRHADVKALPFSTEELAVGAARDLAGDMALPEGCDADHVEYVPGEQEIDPADRDDGLVLWLVYSIEGDDVKVVKRQMNAVDL